MLAEIEPDRFLLFGNPERNDQVGEPTLALVPMKILAPMLTKPAAGVTATSPTTAPTHAPSADGFCPRIPSKKIQASADHAAVEEGMLPKTCQICTKM